MYSKQPIHDQRAIQALIREARCYPPERELRITKDVSDCCRSFPGVSPVHDYYQHDNQVVRLLVLTGTIPIIYRQITYHIPVSIVCRPHYPNDPPVAYVRPTADMQLNNRLRHGLYSLDAEGRVYFRDNTNTWEASESNLYILLVAMRRAFSQEPPVLSKPTYTVQPSEEPERLALIQDLSRRLGNRFSSFHDSTQNTIAILLQKQEELRLKDEHANDESRQRCSRMKSATENAHRLNIQKYQLQQWKSSRGDNVQKEQDLQQILQYADVFEDQIAKCKSKDHAFTDALDAIDEACARNVVDSETYIRNIRNISGEQFYARALKAKVEKARANQPDNDGHPSRGMSTRAAPLYAS